MTQPTPRNIGRRNIHNTNPSIAPIIPTNQRRTLFMRLRLEMDALPRLTPKSAIRAAFGKSEASFVSALIGTGFDMLLFVFIVRHFFYASYRLSKFCLLVERLPCGEKEGLFALWVKNTSRPTGRSGDFSAKRQKNSPATHVFESEQAKLPGLIVSHNLELRLRDGENE